MVVSTEDWTTPVHTFTPFGGQGAMTVNSSAPDSDRSADVPYPFSPA